MTVLAFPGHDDDEPRREKSSARGWVERQSTGVVPTKERAAASLWWWATEGVARLSILALRLPVLLLGEIRPTFSIEAKPRYLRSLQKVPAQGLICSPTTAPKPETPPVRDPKLQEKPQPVYAERGHARVQPLRMVWPIVCRRLEGLPNINAMQLFEELCIQFPGRFTRKQYKTLLRRVNLWRRDARARGVVIGTKTYRQFSDKPRGRRPDIFADHWVEMMQCLEEHPDQTALELLIEFQARYPGRYSMRQLYTMQKRVRAWRKEAVQRLIAEVSRPTPYPSAISP